MTEPDSIVRAQMEALLRRVAREQETQSRRARDAAEEQARSIVARVWEEARARLRQAVEEERRDIEHAVADCRAALETVNRQREQVQMMGKDVDHEHITGITNSHLDFDCPCRCIREGKCRF